MCVIKSSNRIVTEVEFGNLVYLTRGEGDLLEVEFRRGKFFFSLNGKAVSSVKTKLTAKNHIIGYLNTGFVLDLIV
tara:strand:- start:877 stop:1104 length:228 start_codon:yes stop_codon:yes gene_type:complete